MSIPQRLVMHRGPQDDEELWWTTQALFGMRLPRTKVCKNHVSPFRAFADAYFARYPVIVWKASRGFGGKSRTLGLLGLTEMSMLGCEVSVLGGSGAQSLNVHATSQEAWNHYAAPKDLLVQAPTKFDTHLTNGGHMRSLMASQTSVRGPHPQRLRLDEIDEMDMEILEGAQGQPMRKRGPYGMIETQTVMSSTHQYPDGTMTKIMQRAREKGWPIYEWCIAEGSPVTTERGQVPIERVRLDDRVLTRNGFRDVQHVTLMGVKQVIRLTFDNGRTLTCTPDHLLHTAAGWVAADSAHTVTTILPDVPVGPIASVVRVETLNPMPVWDIGVFDDHEFVVNGFLVHNCWRETCNPIDGWLTHDEVERKRMEIPQHMWETEYDLQEPSFEGRAIDTEAVEDAFDPDLGTFSGDTAVKAEPVAGRQYITGIDWAKQKDMTIVATFDTTELPWVCVGWMKINRLPWPVMINMALQQWQRYGGRLVHDATGIGNVVDDYIKDELTRHEQSMVKPIVMAGGKARHNLFSEYVACLENRDMVYPRIDYAYDEHRYVVIDDLFGRGHPPDSIVAAALAWSQRRHKIVVGAPFGGVRAGSPWKV